MDLSDPTRAVTGQLDGTVLAVLATAGTPLTVGQIAERAARGSEIGIRKSLSRLIAQGIVRATLMGRNQVHELNRDHVAADIAVELAGLRTKLWRLFRDEFRGWRVRPLYAAVFGSAARGDGDEDSDIDLLLVHPLFPGEPKPRGKGWAAARDMLGDYVAESARDDPEPQWQRQLDILRPKVESWTGNPLQIVDLSFVQWRRPDDASELLLKEVLRDGVELVTTTTASVWAGTKASHA